MRPLILLLISLLSLSTHAGERWICRAGDALYLPTIELVKGHKKILILGFIHYGPKPFFTNMQNKMKDWIGESSERVTILTELYTCRSAGSTPHELKSEVTVTKAQIEALGPNAGGDQQTAQKLLGEKIHTRPCILDVDGVNIRPAYVVERNQMAEKYVNNDGLGMHWNFQYPRAPHITTRSGDLVIDQQPVMAQVIGSLGYRAFSFPEQEQKAAEAIYSKLFDWYMLDVRNQRVVGEALKELQSIDRVIIPWGAAHNEGIEDLLVSEGFQVTRRSGVRFAAASDVGLPEHQKVVIQSYVDMAQPMAGLCEDERSTPTPATAPLSRSRK